MRRNFFYFESDRRLEEGAQKGGAVSGTIQNNYKSENAVSKIINT